VLELLFVEFKNYTKTVLLFLQSDNEHFHGPSGIVQYDTILIFKCAQKLMKPAQSTTQKIKNHKGTELV